MLRSVLSGLIMPVCLLLLLTRCEYVPDMVFDRNIHKPDSAYIGLTLSPSDSVYTFYESSSLSYNLNTFGMPVYSTSFFMDENKIRETLDTTGTLYFDFYDYSLGEHTLTMVVTTGSNSGSLADLLHAEGYQFSQSWKIIFAKTDPPPASPITRIWDTAGTVMISWAKYNGIAFKDYEIIKASDLNGNVWDEQVIRTVTDQNITKISDSTHVGGLVYYRIQVRNSGGYAKSDLYVHETNKSNLQATWIGGNKIRLSWNQCIFYQNFKSYHIRDETFSRDVIHSIDTAGITSWIYEGGVFGGANKFTISTEAKVDNFIYNDNNSSSATVNVGQSFPVFSSFNNNQVNNNVYLMKSDFKLQKINAATGQSSGTLTLPYGIGWCAVSPADNLIIMPSTTSFSGFIRLDPASFSNLESVTLPGTQGPCYETTLSVNGTGMLHYIMPQTGYGIYNFMQKTSIFNKNTTDLSCGKISADGRYVVTGFSFGGSPATCYSVVNNDFQQLWTATATPVDFVMNSNNLVLVNSATSTVEIRDLTTSQVAYSFPVGPNDKYQDTDPFQPLMLFTTSSGYFDQNKLKVYNYTTGMKVFEMTSMNTGSSSFAIQDSTIFSGAGFRIRIP